MDLISLIITRLFTFLYLLCSHCKYSLLKLCPYHLNFQYFISVKLLITCSYVFLMFVGSIVMFLGWYVLSFVFLDYSSKSFMNRLIFSKNQSVALLIPSKCMFVYFIIFYSYHSSIFFEFILFFFFLLLEMDTWFINFQPFLSVFVFEFKGYKCPLTLLYLHHKNFGYFIFCYNYNLDLNFF